MSKKPAYSVVPDGTGCFLAMRLHAVATFLEEELANDFAKMKNGGDERGPYSVSSVDSEFFVLRNDKIALFYAESFANEYVATKEARVMPAGHVVSSPPTSINHDAIWAEAAAMVAAGK
jgi:hypothetical protein